MRLFVIVATLGRPEIVGDTVRHLERQVRPPDGVVISAVQRSDVPDLAPMPFPVEVVLGEKGLCRQRNRALDEVAGRADVILFLDDDFVPADDYLAVLERLFADAPDLVGLTGRIVADGINGAGYGFAEAVALLGNDAGGGDGMRPISGLYGCNMAYRMASAEGLRFDETLPLYSWLEDLDFSVRVGRKGRLAKAEAIAGVHMGVKGGRTSGLRLGYSQIANPLYLLRKRSVPRGLAWRLMRNNLLANVGRSLRPEPHVDRVGRLRGNLIAVGDLLRGRLDPRRILDLG